MSIIFFQCLLLALISESRRFLRHKRKINPELLKEKYVIEPNCPRVYEAGISYNNNADVPKYTPESFSPDKPSIFAKVVLNTFSKNFVFNYMSSEYIEGKEHNAIKKFFEDLQFPPKLNWFDLKECCIVQGKHQDKEIFSEICFSMIYAFINYRYSLMIKYLEKAFQEGMRGQDYINGEVKLTKEQILEKTKRSKSISKKGPRKYFGYYRKELYRGEKMATTIKAGKKIVKNRDEYDFPSDDYTREQEKYILVLKKRFESSCSISYIIPSPCSEYLRVCPFFFNSDFTQYIPNAKEIEDAKENSKSISFKDDLDYYYSYHCLKDGYYLTCSDYDKFKETLKDNTVDEDIRRESIKVYYFGSVTATSDLDFTILTFSNSVIKNYHMQRIIIDNFNNRFQNDMTIMSEGSVTQCLTSGDCLDTNGYLTGFLDSKFKSNEITGINDIDEIFATQSNTQYISEFTETTFTASSALGMMALVQFWREMMIDNVSDTLDLEYNINFQEGILDEFEVILNKPEFFTPIIPVYFNMLGVNGLEYELMGQCYKDDLNKKLYSRIKKFSNQISDNIFAIRKIMNDANKEVGIESNTMKFQKSVKLNQAYTMLTLDAIETISHVQPVLSQVTEDYKTFILKKGTALMFANEAYYNIGAIKYQTKESSILCSLSLEAAFMITGYAVKHYYELYPKNQQSYSLFKHGDALLKLAKYFTRLVDIVQGDCRLMGLSGEIKLFLADFEISGFIDDIGSGSLKIEENGKGFESISLKSEKGGIIDNIRDSAVIYTHIINHNKLKKDKIDIPYLSKDLIEVKDKVYHMRYLLIFSRLAMNLKKKYGQDPLILYEKVIELEKNVLSQINGYVVGSPKKSVGSISIVVNFILTSMTIAFYTGQISEDFILKKLVEMINSRVSNLLLGSKRDTYFELIKKHRPQKAEEIQQMKIGKILSYNKGGNPSISQQLATAEESAKRRRRKFRKRI